LREGRFQANTRLAAVEILDIGGEGPEDVAVDSEGRIYGGLVDGRIMRLPAKGGTPEVFADTKGRPLGLDFDATGNLIVADALLGLLSVDKAGKVDVLTTEQGGLPYGFTDDVDVGSDGRYYFSDASSKWDRFHLREEFFEHRAHGRLLVYDPGTGETTLLLDDLFFANGIAVSNDASFVLVNETSSYRIRRFWLTGPRSGENEIFIDNLPGHPDGISSAPDGNFWLALFSPRMDDLDSLLPKGWLRKVVYRLPQFLQPDPTPYAFVLGLDPDGQVIANLQDPAKSSYSPITSAQVAGEWLYFGSLSYQGVARVLVETVRGR